MSKDDHKDPKERQRVTKACDNCRKKKIKCDAKADVCTSCELLQIPCQYLDPTKKRGPPKGAGRYINAIEDRLHRMEAIVGGLVHEDEPTLLSGNEKLTFARQGNNHSLDSTNAHHTNQLSFQQSFQQQPFQSQHTFDHHQQQQQQQQQQQLQNQHDFTFQQQQQQQQQTQQQQQLHQTGMGFQPMPQPQPQPTMHQQHPYQFQPSQQFIRPQQQQQHPNSMLNLQLESSTSPDMHAQIHPEPMQTASDTNQTSPLHRSLFRDSTFTSFNSPSPILGSEREYAESTSPKADGLPTLGVNTPPVREVNDLEEDMGMLTIDSMGKERYVGKSSPMYYSRWTGDPSFKRQESADTRQFTDNPDLPSPETMTLLLNLHFTYVHPFAPVFVWSKFLKRLQNRDYTPSFLFLLNSIFALASRYSDDLSLRTDPARPETVGLKFVEKARAILDTIYDQADLYCVGALVLLAFQQMGTGGGYRSWMYVGMSIRMAQHLGLNRDNQKLNPNMPLIDREERSRIWWTCFMADRIISASFGRPQGINEHDVDAQYPEGIDEEDIQLAYKLENAASMLTGPSPDSEKNFVYMASLMRILGRVMVSLYSPLSKASSLSTSSMTNSAPLEILDKELTDWLLTLPPHLHFRSVQQEPGTFVVTLHFTFYATLILLHRPYSHHSSHRPHNDPSISLAICTSAANNTVEMASNMMRAKDDKRDVSRLKGMLHNSVFIFFTAGMVHITNCTSLDPVLAASAKLRTVETLRCLSVLEDVWITAKWCGNNIKQLIKARNIQLPGLDEDLKKLPLQGVESCSVRGGQSPANQIDASFADAFPKTQSFAFDIDQIMGYYQGPNAKHAEPMGRNSKHFSPAPYFSPVSSHHHAHMALKSHPGLIQGHSPLPRRPRQGKNASPSPAVGSTLPGTASPAMSTTGSLPASPAAPNFFSNLQESNTGFYEPAMNQQTTLIDPFAAPGSATLPPAGVSAGVAAAGGTSSTAAPLEQSAALNTYQNPFSSSLWGLPTSIDNDEWMMYMQSGGATATTTNSEHTPKHIEFMHTNQGSLAGSPISGASALQQSTTNSTDYDFLLDGTVGVQAPSHPAQEQVPHQLSSPLQLQ